MEDLRWVDDAELGPGGRYVGVANEQPSGLLVARPIREIDGDSRSHDGLAQDDDVEEVGSVMLNV